MKYNYKKGNVKHGSTKMYLTYSYIL